jgi:hypothetical protein
MIGLPLFVDNFFHLLLTTQHVAEEMDPARLLAARILRYTFFIGDARATFFVSVNFIKFSHCKLDILPMDRSKADKIKELKKDALKLFGQFGSATAIDRAILAYYASEAVLSFFARQVCFEFP